MTFLEQGFHVVVVVTPRILYGQVQARLVFPLLYCLVQFIGESQSYGVIQYILEALLVPIVHGRGQLVLTGDGGVKMVLPKTLY